MFNEEWGGLPAEEFFNSLGPKLGAKRKDLFEKTYTSDKSVGKLSKEWAEKLGLSEEIEVAVGGFDAHLGAIGAGVKEGTMVKIIGTSTCDILVSKEIDED